MTQTTETVEMVTAEGIAARSQHARDSRGVPTWTIIVEFEECASWETVKRQLFDLEESPLVFVCVHELGEDYYKANTVAALKDGPSASVTVEISTHDDGCVQWLRVYVDSRADHETDPHIVSTVADYISTEFDVVFELPAL